MKLVAFWVNLPQPDLPQVPRTICKSGPLKIRDHSATMKSERRRRPRKKPEQLGYINLEPNNGGILLDVSEEGLSFHAVAPVETGPVRFWFSLGAEGRIEATGEVVWTDETKKMGGIRFASLSGKAREQIGRWVARSNVPVTSVTHSPSSVAAPNESPRFSATEQDAAPASHAPRQRKTTSYGANALSLFATPPTTDRPEVGQSSPIPTAWLRRRSRSQFMSGFLAGILVSALLATAFFLDTYRAEVGELLIRLRERSTSKIEPETVPPAPTTIPAPNPSPADAAPTEEVKVETPPTQIAPGPVATTTPREAHDLRASPPTETGEPELSVAQKYLQDTNGRRNTDAGARLLWAALRKGNTSAAVPLADLYRRGDGVAKSCDQARVLLMAASRRGNVTAMEKLRELNTNGCP